MKPSARSQFRGCLLGECLGDALGFPMEGCAAEACARYVREVLQAGDPTFARRTGYAAGQYTDDSQLARELMQSIVEKRRFSPRDYARRIATIFSEKRIVGEGLTTARSAQRLIAGADWKEAGDPPPHAGNGSAMRAAPIGLLFHDDPHQLIESACNQGRITHQDPRCSAGAVAIAGAVAFALEGGSIDPHIFLERLSGWVSEIDESFALFLEQMGEWIDLPEAEACALISVAGKGQSEEYVWKNISPFVIPSVLWSLYAFLRHPNDYWETICTAIVAGGDVDSTAAMAGAVSGARLGEEALPDALTATLNDRGTWGRAELVNLADAFYDLTCSRR